MPKLQANSKHWWEGEPPDWAHCNVEDAIWCMFCKRWISPQQIDAHDDRHRDVQEGWKERYEKSQQRTREREHSFRVHGPVEAEALRREERGG